MRSLMPGEKILTRHNQRTIPAAQKRLVYWQSKSADDVTSDIFRNCIVNITRIQIIDSCTLSRIFEHISLAVNNYTCFAVTPAIIRDLIDFCVIKILKFSVIQQVPSSFLPNSMLLQSAVSNYLEILVSIRSRSRCHRYS